MFLLLFWQRVLLFLFGGKGREVYVASLKHKVLFFIKNKTDFMKVFSPAQIIFICLLVLGDNEYNNNKKKGGGGNKAAQV